jgi:hypothetical protein
MKNPFENPIVWVKLLKGAPLSIYLILKILQHPVGIEALIALTDYDYRSVRQGLRMLQELGIVLHNGRYEGWSLAKGADQLPLSISPAEDLKATPAPDDWEDFGPEDDAVVHQVIDVKPETLERDSKNPSRSNNPEADEIKDTLGRDSKNPSPSHNSPEEAPEIKNTLERDSKNPFRDGKMLTRSHNPRSSSSSSLTNTTREIDLLTTRTKSEISEVLEEFGIQDPAKSQILGMADIAPEWVRGHLETCETTGQAIYRIKQRWNLPRDYQAVESPHENLPQIASDDASETPETVETAEDPLHNSEMDRLWERVKGELLRDGMSKASFDTWVKPVEVQSYDQETGGLVLQAGNAFACDWLTERLSATIQRMLCGMVDKPKATVKFVVE